MKHPTTEIQSMITKLSTKTPTYLILLPAIHPIATKIVVQSAAIGTLYFRNARDVIPACPK